MSFWMVFDIGSILLVQMTPESIEDTSNLVLKTSNFLSDATQHFLDLLQEDAEGIADKDPDLSLDVKSRGSPYGLQHCTRLVGSADPGDGVFGTVSTNGDYTFHVHVL